MSPLDNVSPYRFQKTEQPSSHRFPACKVCRQRKIRCNIDDPSKRCHFCRTRDLPCETSESRHQHTESSSPSRDRRRRTPGALRDDRVSGHVNPGDRLGVEPPGSNSLRGVRSNSETPFARQGTAMGAGQSGYSPTPRCFAQRKPRREPYQRPSFQQNDTNGSAEALAQFTSPEQSASMVMNPPMAEDLQVLDRYLTSRTARGQTSSEPYRRVSSTSSDDSIVYLSLPRERKGLQATIDPGRAQREIMEQILGQQKVDVLNLYFQKLHPCLPIVDEASFWHMWHYDRARISSPLLCEMYAVSLVFWRCSDALRSYGQPDMPFAWNQAVTALRDDLLAPCMTTVHACLLAITGRPTIGVTGNVVKAGSMITLAHSLALHRDPSSWQISAAEKRIRTIVWWAVVIHDYWSSIAHGTPPNIRRENHDVPLPDADDANPTFRHLCSISEILGDILPLIYALRIDTKEAEKSVRRLECRLDSWVDEVPSLPKPAELGRKGINGASNLWFCFLSVKLLLSRVTYKTAIRKTDVLPEEKQYRLAALRDSAIQVAEYIIGLNDENLLEFWLPYTAYLLVSTATTLLRAAIESAEEAKAPCVRVLLGLSERLAAARETLSWDIGDFCLQRCKPTIDKLAAALGINGTKDVSQVEHADTPARGVPHDLGNENPSMGIDLLLPLDSLDYQFDLFDDFAGPWAVNG